MIKVGIIGASGYGAGELLRLLATHDQVEVIALVSSSSENALASDLHPQLTGFYESLCTTKELKRELFSNKNEQSIIFCALPHGASGNYTLSLMRDKNLSHVKIIDLSGDLRLTDKSNAQKWYPETDFITSEREQIVYGLPEINQDKIKTARIVANPGCLASAAILALAPFKISGEVVIDAKTGTSGAGRTPQANFHHPSMHANSFAYKVLEHRHEPEIQQIIAGLNSNNFSTTFVPHVIPASRGIYLTAYFNVLNTNSSELTKIAHDYYKDSQFIKVLDNPPELRSVIGSNFCHFYVKERDGRVVIMLALDNLVKGMAGVAVQNMNLMFGLDEHLGLRSLALGII
jgi:N-acetyl-gamma-glutamyl-phosphate reductase